MRRQLAIAMLVLAGALVGSQANAGFISIMVTNGQPNGMAAVFNVDTATGAATMAAPAQDPSTAGNQFSPNALGISPDDPTQYFYTTYDQASDESFFRNLSLQISLQTADNAIAAGDAFGTNYYYVDRDGKFVTISDIFGTPVAGSGQAIGDPPFPGETYGDLAVNLEGGDLIGYLSHGASLSKFNIDDPGGGFLQTETEARFVGLGFWGDELYGVRLNDPQTLQYDLYRVYSDLTTQLVTAITGVPNGYFITDASRKLVPEPTTFAMGAMVVIAGLGFQRIRRSRKRD